MLYLKNNPAFIHGEYRMPDAGIRFERRVFHSVFAIDDQKEGMRAFIEKRPPTFTNR